LIVRRAYKFRLYPTTEQEALLRQHGGNARFLWNHLLRSNQDRYEQEGKFTFAHEMIVSLPSLKKEHDFLKLSFSQSLQQVARHLDRALKDCFSGDKKFPRFKRKGTHSDSFTIPQKYRIGRAWVFIPKIGEVKWVKHRAIKGKIKHLTVSQDGEQWFCSVNVELRMRDREPKGDSVVGIDMGLTNYATLSNGSKISNPRLLRRFERRIIRAQRCLSRRTKGGNNRAKQARKLARLYRRSRNARRDFQHKTTSQMIAKFDGFVLETLGIRDMMQDDKRAKSIGDAGWFEWKRQLRYKSAWNGKLCLEIDRWEPSSKTCHVCGWKYNDMDEKVRKWTCSVCKTEHDRDENAAINIREVGLHMYRGTTREFTPVETGGCSPAVAGQCRSLKQEKEVSGRGGAFTLPALI